MPATHMAAAIRKRELSPLEVVDAVLERIERVNPILNAFVVVLAERARFAARQATESIIKGEPLGLLHGVPILIKDSIPVRGVQTTYGSKAFAHFIPDNTAVAAERLLFAGGILMGKTTLSELGHKGVTESLLCGTTNNPWKLTHTVGGSSGGAAAAIAAGLGQLAQGIDGAGSLRIPASCCGVVGFKPSFGRVPTYGVSTGYSGLVHVGPITRTVADAAFMLTALAGPDDRDPYSFGEKEINFLQALEGASIRGVRVAYSRDLKMGPVDPQVIALTDTAAQVFAEHLGAIVEEVSPEVPNPEEAMMTIYDLEDVTAIIDGLLPNIAHEEIDPSLLEALERAQKLTAIEYYRAANLFRSQYYRKMIEFFGDYELLITPTITTPPFPHPGRFPGPSSVAGEPINRLLGWLLTYPFNITGQPAISVPCGFSSDGLPIGLQIVGRRHADISVLRAAAAYEQAAPWINKHPPAR